MAGVSGRRYFLDKGVGETRAVVTLDGRPERLLIQRDGDNPVTALGARSVARVRSVEKAIGVAFLDLPGDVEALYSLRADRSEEHTSELQSLAYLLFPLLL